MTVSASIQLAFLTGVVSLGYGLFGGFLLKRYRGIGVKSLAAFSILWGANYLSASLVVYVLASNGITAQGQLHSLSLPETTQLVLISTTPLSGLFTVAGIFAWLWFALRYTRRIGRREKVAVAALGGLTFLVATLNGFVGAAATFEFISIDPDFRTSFHRFASAVEVLGTGVAVGVGIGLLYETAANHRPFRQQAVVGLSVPIVFPWLVRNLYRFGLVTGFQTISILRIASLSVGFAGLWLAVTEYDLFDQLPASRSVGRQTAFEASDSAIVVINNEGNVSDLNPAARELFSVSACDTVGASLDDLLPATVDSSEFRDGEPITVRMPNSETVVEAVMTTATDDSGTPIGRTIVFTDITAERRRQQRIQVLNRVLRHNLRNDLNVAKGYVDVMADGGGGTEPYQRKIETLIDDLVTIGKKAQNTEHVLDADPLAESATPLPALITDALDSVAEEYDDVPVSGSVPKSTAVRINPMVIGSIIEELIENAVRHTDSAVTVSYDDESTTLIVADEGPGIHDNEIAVLDNAQETDLEHGSGLGLWLVKWGTDSFGGSVEFDTDETGTRVRVSIPADLVEETA
ncbi:MAG: ATP-binding protein [Euryarchaeota archaeon]|nr:ATP-binding protein [Euryarchaeota archaeon]